ncbi:DUF4123 domain-containing protein [Vibrio jasicida]|uniref:DUF4123 domain-containing protein n=1 Tax=Vibrio jasicida TaxID=766224 RepID=UPI0005EDDB90|nr:DUF4123 domain-containing protein [Vibrio jasicida]
MNHFWLAGAAVYKEAREHVPIDGAVSVFVGDEFAEVMDLTPWLIPAIEITNLPHNMVEKGILIESEASLFEVNQHLNSVLFVMLDGEEVLFRFYDPDVLAPLIAQFNHVELDEFLGNINTLYVFPNGEIKQYVRSAVHDYDLQVRPWWRLNVEYMKANYDVAVHAHGISRRLWEVYPQVMRHSEDTINQVVRSALEQAHKMELGSDSAEIYALVAVLNNSVLTSENVAKTFYLNSEEQFQLEQFLLGNVKDKEAWA